MEPRGPRSQGASGSARIAADPRLRHRRGGRLERHAATGRKDARPPQPGRPLHRHPRRARAGDARFRSASCSPTVSCEAAGDGPPAFTVRFRRAAPSARSSASGTSGCSSPTSTATSTSTAIWRWRFAPASTPASTTSPTRSSRCATAGTSWRYSNRSLAQAKANARFHYGLGDAFYRPWLDRAGMMYTCAYWSEGTTTLEEAQRNKMDHVCRKVAARGRRHLRRRRLRLGRPAVPRLGALRRARHRHQHDDRAGGRAARRDRAPRPRRHAPRRRVRLPRDARASTTSCCRSARSSTPAATSCPAVIRAHADALKPGGLGVIHFIGHVGTLRHRVLHPRVHLPRRLDSEPRRRRSTAWSAAASRCSTSRTCAATTR